MINKINHKHILIVGGLLFFILSVWNIMKFNVPVVIHDEFGYLANAAFMAGKDWSGITPMSPYYSYGYSLLLVPLFWLDLAPEIIYKMIILINIFFYLFSYWLSFICFRKVFGSTNSNKIALFCSIVMFYGAYIFNSHVAWAEAFIYLLFWIALYLLISLMNNANLFKSLLFAVILTYMYVVHQRSIGIVCCGIVAMILLIIDKKITPKQFLVFIIIIGLSFVLQNILKNYVTSHIWNQPIISSLADLNDYGGQISKILDILTVPTAFFKVVRGILAKYLYLLISSGSIIAFGLVYCIKSTIQYLRNKDSLPVIEIFCFLSLLSSIAISSIFFYQSQRLDTIIYGRYSEFVLGPLLIFGLYELTHIKFSFKIIGAINLYALAISIAIYQYMTKYELFLYVCTVNAAPFFQKSTYQFMFVRYILFGILLCSVFYYCWTRNKQIFKILGCILLISYWNYAVYDVYKDDIYICQDYGYNMSLLAQQVNKIDNQLPLYYVYDYEPANLDKNKQMEILQYLLPNTPMTIIQKDEITSLKGEYYLAFPQGIDINFDKYKIITQANGVILTIPKKSKLIEKVNSNQYIFTPNMLYSDYSQNIRLITPMLGVNDGDYEIHIVIDSAEESNSVFEIVSNGQIVYSENLFLTVGKKELIFNVKCVQNQSTYFVLYDDNCENVKIESVYYYSI